jgi:amidophosphoribosyltransferase
MREVGRGEILKLTPERLVVLQKQKNKVSHYCEFEWAYFSHPNSMYPTHEVDSDKKKQWLSYARFRERCGEVLATENKIKNASFVVGIPDSGVYVAMGYSNKAHIPYRQCIVRDHFNENDLQRLFMTDNEMQKIGKRILKKLTLNPDRFVWKDAIVVVGDDSIVRGNVSNKITKAIFAMGAREVHWVVGFPPVAHPCFLGVSMRSGEELIAHRHSADPKKIAAEIGATSVTYISPQGFIRARKLMSSVKVPASPKMIFLENGGCGGCITGNYPVNRDGTHLKT